MIELTDSRGHNNGPLSCKDKGFSQNSTSGGATALSNGDVEMESEDDDDEDLPLLPLPKVRILKMWFRNSINWNGDIITMMKLTTLFLRT